MQKLLSKLRRCITDFDLIDDGDKICVGLSGGKDSIALLYLLKSYQRFSPEKFELIALTLDPGYGSDYTPLKELCESLNIEYHIIKSQIKEVVFDIRKEKNPCSLCAKMRRGALNDNAKQLGCTKVALGHHKNDAIETLLLSMLYEGRISCFEPKTYLSRMDITIIRPMLYLSEPQTKHLSIKYNFPIIENPCPVDGNTKREYMKNLISSIENDIPGVKNRLLNCLVNKKQLNIWDIKNND